MNRHIIPVSHPQLTSLDLEAFISQAKALNQQNHNAFNTPFPKAPSRWISHYQFHPRPITFTDKGAVEGGLSWLVGATLDFSFARSLCADAYDARGGHCYDPASLLFLEVAAKVDRYPDYASFCEDLEQADKGRCYRELAGLDKAIPGQDSFSNFRKRVGHSIIDQTTAIMVQLFIDFDLIKGQVVSTDGQLEPTHSRFKGCAYACQGCQELSIDEASRHDLAQHLQSGSMRLEMMCPFPEVVDKVREATAKKGAPKDPKVTLLEVEPLPPEQAASKSHPKLAELLGVPQDQLPPVRLKWSHLSLGPSGELLASCPKVPSDLEAGVGYHVDTKNPGQKERVFGYLHLKTTDLHPDFALELPLGNSTYAANADEGTEFIGHRSALAMPMRPGQIQLADAANDQIANYHWVDDQGGIAVFDYNPRNEHLDAASLLNRGYDQNGTPYAPCGRLCHSNGYDYQAQSRQYVGGLACPTEEQKRCPHRHGVLGYCHRMRFKEYPRLIRPIQRGSKAWHDFYQARSSSERTNSYDQEVVGNAHPLRMRGLKAFRFAGALRTLAQLLRRALNFVLDVTYTQGTMPVTQNQSTALFDNTRRMASTLSFPWKQEARCVSIEVSISD